jgi:predicted TIM-barrel fold metal-dependent hydrolase
MASLIFGNLFGRFPGLRVLSIENGSRWVPKLLADMDHVMHYTQPTTLWPGGALSGLPSETFKQHVHVAPFYEPHYEVSVRDLVDLLGVDRVIFGSDWPHGEGKATPNDDLDDLEALSDAERHTILRDNGLALLGLAGA